MLVVFVVLAVLGAGGYAWLQGRDTADARWTDVVVEIRDGRVHSDPAA